MALLAACLRSRPPVIQGFDRTGTSRPPQVVRLLSPHQNWYLTSLLSGLPARASCQQWSCSVLKLLEGNAMPCTRLGEVLLACVQVKLLQCLANKRVQRGQMVWQCDDNQACKPLWSTASGDSSPQHTTNKHQQIHAHAHAIIVMAISHLQAHASALKAPCVMTDGGIPQCWQVPSLGKHAGSPPWHPWTACWRPSWPACQAGWRSGWTCHTCTGHAT